VGFPGGYGSPDIGAHLAAKPIGWADTAAGTRVIHDRKF